MSIPSADSVSPAWFTEQLRAAGHEVEVASFVAQQIGTGQIGKCVRYSFEFSEADATGAAPRSVVVKYPSDDPTSRATGVVLKNFLKEVRFYQTLQSRLRIRTPVCYYAEIEGDGPEFAVMMQDLAPAAQGDQLAGCDARVARAAVLELVGLHAPLWCDAELLENPWLRDLEAVRARAANDSALQGMYAEQLPGFLDRYGEYLSEGQRGIIARVAESPSCPLFADLPERFSLVHVDYRLDNLMISADEVPDITVVDWQSITLGAPLNDVAYFLGAGMDSEPRMAAEDGIVRDYYRALGATGVADYAWEECWQDYRRGAFAGFGVTVIASMIVQRTDRGDQMFTTMARRHAQHAIDVGADEFLD